MSWSAAFPAETCRLYVLFVLAAASSGKAAGMTAFEATIADLSGASGRLARAAAFAIVGAEALAALLLAAGGGLAEAGMAAALALFALFTAAILVALVQRRAISCNCFGGDDHAMSGGDLVRNLVLIAACGVYLRYAANGPPLGLAAWLSAAGLAFASFLATVGFGRIARRATPRTAPIGQAVPPFEGKRRAGGGRVASADLAGRPAVLAFLSPGCPKCDAKAAELIAMLPAMARAGVDLWVIPNDDFHDVMRLAGAAALADHILILDAAARLRLNPTRMAPFYLFLDEDRAVVASEAIGDANWLSFAGQMKEEAVREDC